MSKTCNYPDCERGTYGDFCLSHKPKKPIRSNNVPLKRTPLPRPTKRIKQKGKHYELWQATRKAWFAQNPPPHFCYICGKPVLSGIEFKKNWLSDATTEPLTLDHIKSRSSRPDLRYELNNLAPCCWTCNNLKGSRSLEAINKERT